MLSHYESDEFPERKFDWVYWLQVLETIDDTPDGPVHYMFSCAVSCVLMDFRLPSLKKGGPRSPKPV